MYVCMYVCMYARIGVSEYVSWIIVRGYVREYNGIGTKSVVIVVGHDK